MPSPAARRINWFSRSMSRNTRSIRCQAAMPLRMWFSATASRPRLRRCSRSLSVSSTSGVVSCGISEPAYSSDSSLPVVWRGFSAVVQ